MPTAEMSLYPPARATRDTVPAPQCRLHRGITMRLLELVRGRIMEQRGADVTVPSVSRDNASCGGGAR